MNDAGQAIFPPVLPPVAEAKAAAAAPKSGTLAAMFQDGNTLLRAIVASEVLGPPAALRENHLWNQPPP